MGDPLQMMSWRGGKARRNLKAQAQPSITDEVVEQLRRISRTTAPARSLRGAKSDCDSAPR